ncbi:30S ribosomal protein S20 [Planctopirus ephydatiae]|jgi:small subunit ribosomal protein S20|uniref:Small ribosomal subunit protein bS20 n=1 Tax=Planctopirus ephydatiae TaxID=2528019 RepID=A0A518GLX2_9PLAN|nr:30S ribosomal protein S20 [Planctopirus ephydatiae]QDV29652.1 30S ribosomal protein S20 [Planctopirus ephydatiae]
MPNSDGARRSLRKQLKRRAANRVLRSVLRTTVKKTRLTFTAVVTGGPVDDATTQLRVAIKKIDQMAARGLIHKNKAARDKSRLTISLNKALAAKTAAGQTPAAQ